MLKRYQLIARVELTEAQRDQAVQAVRSSRLADSPWRTLLPIFATLTGAIVTAIVAYLAVVMPLRSQREKDRIDRRVAADREDSRQREELTQRLDKRFAGAAAAIASDEPAVQAGGAATLYGFMRPDLSAFHEQAYQVARAHLDLRLGHPDAIRSILVSGFCILLRETRGPAPRRHHCGGPSYPSVGDLDLVQIWLQRASLTGVDLSEADLWRSDLRNARLDGCSLWRARGWKAQLAGASLREANLEEARFRAARCARTVFDQARLVSARFEEAELDRARFREAELQSAHFQGATLTGADFRNAKVSDAIFLGAQFDDDALASLLLTQDLWKRLDGTTGSGRFTAKLDVAAQARLVELAARRRWRWVPA